MTKLILYIYFIKVNRILCFEVSKIIMARLNKTFEDNFTISIQLCPLNNNSLQPSLATLQHNLNLQQISLPIDQRYNIDLDGGKTMSKQYQRARKTMNKIFEKYAEQRNNTVQRIRFIKENNQIEEDNQQWDYLDAVYRWKFVVGVFDPYKEEQTESIEEQWQNFMIKKKAQSQKVLGLIILTTKLPQMNELSNIKESFIIIPQKLEAEQIIPFLQPWMYAILGIAQTHICSLIYALQKQIEGLNSLSASFSALVSVTSPPTSPRSNIESSYSSSSMIKIFHKNQLAVPSTSSTSTIKKKKKGRYLKLIADCYLLLHLYTVAYQLYEEAKDILVKMDDHLWLLGIEMGKMACFTTEFHVENLKKKQSLIEQTTIQCLLLLKKVRITKIQDQAFHKILKIHTFSAEKFDNIANQYLTHLTITHSNAQKFLLLTQLSMLYKQANLIHRYAFTLYNAAMIILDKKPKIAMLLIETMKKQTQVKQWPILYAHLIKLQIENNCDNNQGILHLQLLENCSGILSKKNLENNVDTLNYSNFKTIQFSRPPQIFQLVSVSCQQPLIKPKPNRISQKEPNRSTVKGLVMNWSKNKQQFLDYKFQENSEITFYFQLRNKLDCSINGLEIFIAFSTQGENSDKKIKEIRGNKYNTKERLAEGNGTDTKLQITIKLQMKGDKGQIYLLEYIKFGIWNFFWTVDLRRQNTKSSLYRPIRIQIYQQCPNFTIQVPEVYRTEQSTPLYLPFCIKRTKVDLEVKKIQLTISIYYHIDVGYQQHEFQLVQLAQIAKNYSQLQEKQQLYAITTPCSDLYLKPHVKTLQIANLKAKKKYLKKIQFKLEAIRTQTSKYQIVINSSVDIQVYQRIWSEVIDIKSFVREQIAKYAQNQLQNQEKIVVEDYFLVYFRICKQQKDLTCYKVTYEGMEYFLAQSTSIIIVKKFLKFQLQEIPKIQKGIIQYFNWCNANKPSEYGKIECYINFSHQMMIMSNRKVNCAISTNNQIIEEKENNDKKNIQIVKIKAQEEILNVKYTVQAQTKQLLNHRFFVQAIRYPRIRNYQILGKTKILAANKDKIQGQKYTSQNKIKIRFVWEYDQLYALGIQFIEETENEKNIHEKEAKIVQKYIYPGLFKIIK